MMSSRTGDLLLELEAIDGGDVRDVWVSFSISCCGYPLVSFSSVNGCQTRLYLHLQLLGLCFGVTLHYKRVGGLAKPICKILARA